LENNVSKIYIIESVFYKDLALKMHEAAESILSLSENEWSTFSVPGVMEIPAALKFILSRDNTPIDAGFIVLGCVIKGETSHHEHVARECMRGLTDLIINYSISLGNGVLTCNDLDQASKRSWDKGIFASQAALTMMDLKKSLL